MASKNITCLIISGSVHVSRAVELFLDREPDINSQVHQIERQGLDRLETDEFYDCIILDLSMLEGNKPETVQILKKKVDAASVIVIDSECDRTLTEALLEAGADECIDLQNVGRKLVRRIFDLYDMKSG